MTNKVKILIVEDDWAMGEITKRILQMLKYEVTSVVASGEEAIEKAEKEQPDLILMDVELIGGMDGIEAASRIMSKMDIPIIYQTSHSDDNVLERAKLTAPFGYLIKPVNEKKLHSSIEMALYKHRLNLELKENRETLMRSEARFRAVADSAVDAIISADHSGKVIEWNQAAQKTFGYSKEEMMNKSLSILMPEKYRDAHNKGIERVAAGGESRIIGTTVEAEGLRKDGREFPAEIDLATWKIGETSFFSAIIHDITERKEKETALRQSHEALQKTLEKLQKTQSLLIRSEKLASLGALSAGVAHEIKNPLNIISTSVQLLLMEDDLQEETKETYRLIMGQVQRAAKITENLRDFARERKPEIREIDLHELLEKTIGLVEYEIKAESLQIERAFNEHPIRLSGDGDQLAQVFLNLIGNARDSMNEKQKTYPFEQLKNEGWTGRLTVTTRVSGHNATISFKDTGMGMSRENMKRIFDPFFTTKEEGKGTGLGLSIAYGIIQEHGGGMEVYGEDGKGAEFIITVPLRQEK